MKRSEVGLFIVRVVLGMTFFLHGLDKFQNGISNIAGWFESIGLPGFLAYIVAVIELVGGVIMVLGIGTRIVGILFALVMAGAIITVKLPLGFLDGFELDVVLLAMSIQIAITGSAFLSLGQAIGLAKESEVNL
ncbi:DoxX family protein [Halalkalibacter alkaliphilus]|uniref:DoxX family protein n=1 Tax=Halalkalibacter alkaliphilus TaxID=2917993 RepID=A0A9X2IA33_9BACI|nr:DoxX family protein [Halalkalibacter alkaliphilus]MCL7749829.1 DoxX family protein [Halalkalibacter alkaliphilus]